MRTFAIRPGVVPATTGITPAGRVVVEFLARVRTTGDAAAAELLMTDVVRCHQVVSEAPETIERTPAQYAAHVRDMIQTYGPFDFVVTEMLCEGDHVYVRWRQDGVDHTLFPVGQSQIRPIVEMGSAVYHVESDRIVEYWIQLDRHGLSAQLEPMTADEVHLRAVDGTTSLPRPTPCFHAHCSAPSPAAPHHEGASS